MLTSACGLQKRVTRLLELFADPDWPNTQVFLPVPAQRYAQKTEKDNEDDRQYHGSERLTLQEQTEGHRILPAGQKSVEDTAERQPHEGQTSHTNMRSTVERVICGVTRYVFGG